ncbi:hypothetical protein AAVH_19972 [Aphelenchoides avenae]|nr:hypothetical protein AAVH_26276 [Aphelenchus avenae]KAH7712696.1 hypothetical protein AAVH_19972 [Aphelenchus avenae]
MEPKPADARVLKPLLELKAVTKPADLHAMLNKKEYEVVSVFTERKPTIYVVVRHKYPFEIEAADDPDGPPAPKKARIAKEETEESQE